MLRVVGGDPGGKGTASNTDVFLVDEEVGGGPLGNLATARGLTSNGDGTL